jgi:hypothetical protein
MEATMIVPVFAMAAPDFVNYLPFGFLFALVVAGIFVRITRNPGKLSEKDRRAGLGCFLCALGRSAPYIVV